MSRPTARIAVLVALTALLQACTPPPFQPGEFTPLEEGDPAGARAVVFLVGDAGDRPKERSPLIHRLRQDVERWSAALPGDSAVSVVFLGDNIYPDGLHDRNHEMFPEDSARLHAQIWTVSGPEAMADKVPGIFLAGNHDWGQMDGAEGLARLRNMDQHLREVSRRGDASVRLLPPSGSPTPRVMELGGIARLILIDTHWWLADPSERERETMMEAVRAALETREDLPAIVASHHPWASGGPHDTRGPFDPFALLAKAGAIVQDLNSLPFIDFQNRLRDAFRDVGAPLIYAGGHDHSLQVVEGTGADEPRWTLVSGAGSKLTGVTDIPGLVWAEAAPGYMRVIFRTDGSVELFVERGSPDYLACEPDEVEDVEACIAEGVAAFSVGYSVRLR